MANTKKYSSLFDILTDTELYMSVRRGDPLNLGLLQSIARSRWTWIVDNWATLKERFKTFADGDTQKEANLEDFERLIASYKLGNTRNPFDRIDRFIQMVQFLELIQISELTLTPEETILIAKERERVSNFVIEDFQAMLAFIKQQTAIASFSIGLGDPDGARLAGVLPTARQRSANVKDLVRIDDTQRISQFIEGIIIDFKNRQDKPPNLLRIANANIADDSVISFVDTYRSAIAVPFEINLEHMAKKYLGSSDRYYELITINKLQPPYIDETGEKYNLLAPGAVNNIIIPGTRKDDIPVGTKITIGSFSVREEPRIIERITENSDGTLILFLSGAQDLAKLKTSEGAFVRIYAPHTVNTGSFILIPLVTPAAAVSQYTPKSDELRRLETVLLNFGVDILRDERTGGLVVDANGNFKLAAGMKNIRQAVLYALRTVRGELPFHPGYGVSSSIGDRYYGTTDEAVIFANLLRQSLLRDSRFADIKIAGIQQTQTGIALTVVVYVAGSNQPIPLSFVS